MKKLLLLLLLLGCDKAETEQTGYRYFKDGDEIFFSTTDTSIIMIDNGNLFELKYESKVFRMAQGVKMVITFDVQSKD